MATFAALRDNLDEFLTSHLDGLENDQRIEALAWYCQGLGFEAEAKTALGLAAAMAQNYLALVLLACSWLWLE